MPPSFSISVPTDLSDPDLDNERKKENSHVHASPFHHACPRAAEVCSSSRGQARRTRKACKSIDRTSISDADFDGFHARTSTRRSLPTHPGCARRRSNGARWLLPAEAIVFVDEEVHVFQHGRRVGQAECLRHGS